MNSIHPLEASKYIGEAYLRYLTTAYPLKNNELAKQFEEELRQRDRFVKGPLLEATPPFKPGCSIQDLINEGILHSDFNFLNSDFMPINRPLYSHQEQAIRKASGEKRNVIIASGTASGKTESFLIPILNHLIEERKNGTLGPGVRALLLYPMNALANDQLKRLRRVLYNFEEITFGRYTGDTKDTDKTAKEHFQKNYPEEINWLKPNELLSRDSMRATPPHILLTNYAMLEYLLLRPSDSEFFDGVYADNWKFIVLDEAHTYNGATGIELAMLIRRLKDRVLGNNTRKLICIATSATISKDEEDFPKVKEFGSKLFGEVFEWNAKHKDIVQGVRLNVDSHDACWEAPPELYSTLQKEISSVENIEHDNAIKLPRIIELIKEHKVPANIIHDVEGVLKSSFPTLSHILFQLLKKDLRMKRIREVLKEGPLTLSIAAGQILSENRKNISKDEAIKELITLVDLAVKAKPDGETQSLLPARYHFFIRALDGAFVALKPNLKLFLERKVKLHDNGCEYPVFELGSCRRCGKEYLVGQINKSTMRLEHPPGRDEEGNVKFYLLNPFMSMKETQDNEDETINSGDDPSKEPNKIWNLCALCGCVTDLQENYPGCPCIKSDVTVFTLKEAPVKKDGNGKCIECSSRGGEVVTRFFTGSEAAPSVIATALYQKLPFSPLSPPHNFRKLIVFSDSRQEAAFFPCYLERTYSQLMWRRLIVKVLLENKDNGIEQWRLQDLVKPLIKEGKQLGLFPITFSSAGRQEEVWKYLLSELTGTDRRHNLEGVGLLSYSVVKPAGWETPAPLLNSPWNLTPIEAWNLFEILLESFRIQNAITFPVDREDDFFAPKNRAYYFRNNGASRKAGVMSWGSPSGGLNRRIDFLQKLLLKQTQNTDQIKELCQQTLKDIWDKILFAKESLFKDYFAVISLGEEGVVFQLRHEMWDIFPNIPGKGTAWYQCNECGFLSRLNIKNVCPTYRCEGVLNQCVHGKLMDKNHYRYLYLNMEPAKMSTQEHTAQLNTGTAAEVQDMFIRGEVNILSCSTTFELGVDVGELEAVFMRNVPPTTANYIQRAGRAGRRTSQTAFVVTFAKQCSHDLNYYNHAEKMVSGKINPPYFELRNEKIIRRHVHAVVLSSFFRKNPDFFGKTDSFFRFDEKEGGYEAICSYLNSKPIEIKETLERIIPPDVEADIGIKNWSWLEQLIDQDPEKGILTKATQEVKVEIADLKELREECIKQQKEADFCLKHIKTIKDRHLIDFFSSRTILPKYGFPVDVVELKIIENTSEESRKLELQRDLKLALADYAPGSEVVAGGKLWKSYGLKLVKKQTWPKYKYAVCENCGRYQGKRIGDEVEQDINKECIACKTPINSTCTFIIPKFGFVTSKNDKPKSPGTKRPQKSYSTRPYFAEYKKTTDQTIRSEKLDNCTLSWKYSKFGQLVVINRGMKNCGFRICSSCGFADPEPPKEKKKGRTQKPHMSPYGNECRGTLRNHHLGHEFLTDVVEITINSYSFDNGGNKLWLSVLYALLEGASELLGIRREDIDGCLYAYREGAPALVLFDNVPGGAGHMNIIGKKMLDVFKAARNRLDSNCCGEETSCYGCLRNYQNQFYHELLQRDKALDFLNQILKVPSLA